MEYKEIREFLKDVTDQVAYKPVRQEIEKELQEHIEDRVYEYRDQGMDEGEAVHKAVEQMGDAPAIGVMMNELHHVRVSRPLLTFTALSVFLGIAAAAAEGRLMPFGLPVNLVYIQTGINYYIFGVLILAAVVHWGYPFLVKHTKGVLAALMIGVVLEKIAYFIYLWTWGQGEPGNVIKDFLYYWFRVKGIYVPNVLTFGILILWGPVMALLVYRWRRKPLKAFLGAAILTGAMVLIQHRFQDDYVLAANLILLATVFFTVLYMIWARLFGRPRWKYGLLWTALFFMTAEIYLCASWSSQKGNIELFITPEKQAESYWDDGYNGVLMKELLRRAGFAGTVELTQEELMNYGTGAWFLDQDQVHEKTTYLHYDRDSVTWTDILPQHYYNNYRIAWWILKYGWGPACVLIAAAAGFYAALFWTSGKIKNPMGKTLALSCSFCLAAQAILYVLGNFGFQYGWFCNLPILSEGLLSISVNMLLTGLVLSVYRYDTVIRREETGHTGQKIRLAGKRLIKATAIVAAIMLAVSVGDFILAIQTGGTEQITVHEATTAGES